MEYTGGGGISEQQISNVSLTITDVTNQVEGETVTAICNGKTFSSVMVKGICRIYSTEVGTYTITAGEYSTMLICPYFGQFSTDIYSGTLQVTCIEAGGNNKTCHVQSCDDNYNFTDSYNLTQTFDSSLVLTFLGIPAGRYLIVVDDQYRFFKEITSIQNVNEVEVELKQWLYKEGDQCEWNTGGWMKCKVGGNGETGILVNNDGSLQKSTTGVPKASVDFVNSQINLNATLTCQVLNGPPGWWCRGGGTTTANIGSIKSIPNLDKCTQLTVVSSSNVIKTIRTGDINSINTTTSTGTVVVSGSTAAIDISGKATKGGMLVVGHSYRVAALSHHTAGQPSGINYSYSSVITQIYLT